MKNKIDKQALREKIQSLEGLSNEDKSQLLALLAEQKKYGLVWEDRPEEAEEVLREKIPVLHEVVGKRLDDGGDDAPNHILIEGDNLHALTALTYTHEGKVDVIYIDPPYNTGNKDFVYNDSFVDSEDSYRHSKWLSFMEKRLKIAKKLLSDKGVIFISIDDNEQANLKLLCDEVFGRNHVGEIIWETATDNNPTQISIDHEYVLCFAKNKEALDKWAVTSDKAQLIKNKYEEIKASGISDLIKIRKELKAWIKSVKKSNDLDLSGVSHYDYVDEKGVFYPGNSANTKPGDYTYDIIHPITKRVCSKPTNGYRWPENTFLAADKRGDVLWGEDETIIPKIKKRIETAKELLKSYYYEDGRAASNALELIIGKNRFNNPKPINLIMKLERFTSNADSLILDFFAGSGTTLHATMQLNAEDGGHRQCILVTNNENNICEEVTYERNKRVINGYTTPKGAEVEGLKANNLRYYKTDFVSRDGSHQSKKEIAYAMTDLLCIKEGIYDEQDAFGNLSLVGKSKMLRYFAEEGKQMLLIYDSRVIPYIVKEIEQMDKAENDIKIYIFADGSFPYTADFADVLDKVTLIAMPYAMERALKLVLPEKEDIELEVEPETIEQDA